MARRNSAIPVVLTQADLIRLDDARSPLLDNFNGYRLTAVTSVWRELPDDATEEAEGPEEVTEHDYLEDALAALAEISDDWEFPYRSRGQPYADNEIKTLGMPLALPPEENYRTGDYIVHRAFLGKLNGRGQERNLGVTEIQFIRAYFRDRRAFRGEV